jgi:hypothetical protein
MAFRELDAMIVREGTPMFWQFLAQLIPRRRRFRAQTVPSVKTVTPEPPRDTELAEVYAAHAAIHGPQKLLPLQTLPSPSRGPNQSSQRRSRRDEGMVQQRGEHSEDAREGWLEASVKGPLGRLGEEPRYARRLRLAAGAHAAPAAWRKEFCSSCPSIRCAAVLAQTMTQNVCLISSRYGL